MYHYHIITREDTEIIKKIYLRQKESHIKKDWYEMLVKDFGFIQEEQDDDEVKKISKSEYMKYITGKVKEAAFQEYMKKKLEEITDERFQIKSYMNNIDV